MFGLNLKTIWKESRSVTVDFAKPTLLKSRNYPCLSSCGIVNLSENVSCLALCVVIDLNQRPAG